MVTVQEAQNDPEMLERFVKENEGLVHRVVRRYLSTGSEYEDYLQEGFIGLIRAIRHFDHTKGVTFSTYAVPTIMGAIKRYQRDNEHSLKTNRETKDLYRKYCYLKGTGLTDQEIIKHINVTMKELDDVKSAMQAQIYMEAPIAAGENISFGETLSCDFDLEESILKNIELKEKLGLLKKKLPGKQWLALNLWISGQGQVEIASKVGISQAQVSRIIKKSEQILKSINEHYNKDFEVSEG